MAVSKQKFLTLFLDELDENLQTAERQILVLKDDTGNEDALLSLLRTLHTVKGSARMLQFMAIEQLVHGLETVFKGVRDGRYTIDVRLSRFFLAALDRLRDTSRRVRGGGEEAVDDLALLLDGCERLAANESFDMASLSQAAASPLAESEDAAGEAIQKAAGLTKQVHDATGQAAPKPEEQSTESVAQATGTAKATEAAIRDTINAQVDSSIKVDSGVIDRSISLVNTLTIRQLRLRSGVDQLDRLEQELNQLYRASGEHKALRHQLGQLGRQLRQYRSQYSDQLFEIEHGTQELRETVIDMRMLPLAVLLERFPRMVDETAASLGKSVRLAVQGDAVRLDRTVLNKLADPLIHLVRNAIDHGIETPEERLEKGKPAQGLVEIDCRTEGNRVSLRIRDDGRGLDYDAIRLRACASWPENEEAIQAMGNDELVRFLFRPGFSTRTKASRLSGRGIGLDIVKTNIEAIKGQIHLESNAPYGSSFSLLLPVSASTMDGMFVRCAGTTFYIPASAITRTLLIDGSEVFQLRQKEFIHLDGMNINLVDLATGLRLDAQASRQQKLSVLLIRGAAETVAIKVDRILGYDSLVYQALPAGLRRHRLIQGMVFDSAFNIIPILNMWAVLDNLRSVRLMDTHKRFSGSAQQSSGSILVVDDSVSTREIEISMLSLEGYSVVGAVDGVDALEKIHQQQFDLIVSDLNMPRMDGLKLLENIRNDEALASLPVILVTTVDEPAVRQRAEQLGVSRYILKSSFDQDNLISAVQQLCDTGGGRRE